MVSKPPVKLFRQNAKRCKKLKKKQSHIDDHECSICFESIHANDLQVTPCNHRFHKNCINMWKATGNQTCPYCREQISFSEFYCAKYVDNIICKYLARYDLIRQYLLTLSLHRYNPKMRLIISKTISTLLFIFHMFPGTLLSIVFIIAVLLDNLIYLFHSLNNTNNLWTTCLFINTSLTRYTMWIESLFETLRVKLPLSLVIILRYMKLIPEAVVLVALTLMALLLALLLDCIIRLLHSLNNINHLHNMLIRIDTYNDIFIIWIEVMLIIIVGIILITGPVVVTICIALCLIISLSELV
jgi:hypothetical protein